MKGREREGMNESYIYWFISPMPIIASPGQRLRTPSRSPMHLTDSQVLGTWTATLRHISRNLGQKRRQEPITGTPTWEARVKQHLNLLHISSHSILLFLIWRAAYDRYPCTFHIFFPQFTLEITPDQLTEILLILLFSNHVILHPENIEQFAPSLSYKWVLPHFQYFEVMSNAIMLFLSLLRVTGGKSSGDC